MRLSTGGAIAWSMHRPRTTTRRLSHFVVLAETGSLTRAAERIEISQTSLSQQIRGLELVIGAPLFERGGPAPLTPLGCEALERASCILLDVTDLEEMRAASADALVGTIRLGISRTPGAYLRPSLAARLHREHPTLRGHIDIQRDRQSVKMVRAPREGRVQQLNAATSRHQSARRDIQGRATRTLPICDTPLGKAMAQSRLRPVPASGPTVRCDTGCRSALPNRRALRIG